MPLKVEAETMIPDDNFVFLAWPVTTVHRINKESPLWDVSAEQLLQVKKKKKQFKSIRLNRRF